LRFKTDYYSGKVNEIFSIISGFIQKEWCPMKNVKKSPRASRLHIAVLVIICAALICIFTVSALDTAEGVLPAAKHIDIKIANNPSGNYIKFDGGGLNALHISSNPLEPYGQVTTSTEQSGTFYFSDTGGRGFFDDLILMVAVNGEVPDNFTLHVRSSGYQWTPTPLLNQPPAETDLTYVSGAIDETFTRDQFAYGPQSWKPAGDNSPMNYPIFYGQDTSDPNTRSKLIFIDLKVGALGPNSGLKNLTDNGFAKIEYSVENLDTYAAFNAYGWCNQSNQGKGITWTNQLMGPGSSGYTVLGTPYSSHKSEFASTAAAQPNQNKKSAVNSTPAPATTITTQKSPEGMFFCIAALCMILFLRKLP
jgi:hypothetical protein